MLIKFGRVPAVQVHPQEFCIADGVVFVRYMAVEKPHLALVRNHGAPFARHGQAAVQNIEHHIIMVIRPLDLVAILREKNVHRM